ncbi:MAG: TnpV protein [Lachnospiraceae bacterium]|nr:TnpV protein [Lachnospiraceae bacterium]
MGGTYTEKDGILYPNIFIGEEQTEAMQDTFLGKYGDLWEKYMKGNHSERYYHMVRTGQLKQKAEEINEEANEMLDRIMQQYLQKHKPGNPDSTMEMWQLREQAKAMAEEVVLQDIVYCYH